MHIDEYTKEIQKIYCRTVLAEHGQLTRELFDQINAGEEEVMRAVYVGQQERIRNVAAAIHDQTDKELTLSQVESIQEVLDALPSILKT